MVTTNLFSHPVFKDGGFTANDRVGTPLRARARSCATSTWLPSSAPRPSSCGAVARAAEYDGPQGHPGRPGPDARRRWNRRRRLRQGARATTCGSRSSPSPTSPAATSCCRPSGTRLAFIAQLEHREHRRPEPRGRARADGRAELRRTASPRRCGHGKLFHIDLNGQHGPRFDQDLRFGAGNLRGAFWTVDTLLGGGRQAAPYDGYVPLRLQAAARRGPATASGSRRAAACATT